LLQDKKEKILFDSKKKEIIINFMENEIQAHVENGKETCGATNDVKEKLNWTGPADPIIKAGADKCAFLLEQLNTLGLEIEKVRSEMDPSDWFHLDCLEIARQQLILMDDALYSGCTGQNYQGELDRRERKKRKFEKNN
jgi:hypothetical protein